MKLKKKSKKCEIIDKYISLEPTLNLLGTLWLLVNPTVHEDVDYDQEFFEVYNLRFFLKTLYL